MPDPTIIRAQTLVQGNLTGEDPVEVEGQLIGQVALQNTLTVHPGGLVRGQLHVTQAVIFGRVEGHITATERVYLGPSAIVIADVEAPLVRVDDGAKLHGKLLMELDAPAPAVAPLALPSSKPAAQQAPKNEPKPSFGSFTSPARPAQPVATQPAAVTVQPVTAQPAVTAPSFASAKPAQTTPPASQPASAAQAPQPTRTAVAVIEPEPAPVLAAPAVVEQAPEIEPEITPDPVEISEPELVEETVVEEPQDEPDEDDAPDAGEDDAANAYAAEAAKYEHYTVKELREELRRLDLPVSGSKEDLIERLLSAQ